MSGNTAPHSSSISVACELLKLLRGQWLDRRQIRDELRLSHGCVDRWTEEMAAQGLLVERKRPARGQPAREFTLAPEWGGNA
jgi:hypothetical protein